MKAVVDAENFLREVRTQVRLGEKEMKVGDWMSVLASADVFVKFGMATDSARRIDEAVKQVGSDRALSILMEG